MLKTLAILGLALGACGAKQPPVVGGTGTGSGSGVASDTRTPYMQRRAAACDKLAPRITECALADAKANLAAGKVKQAEFDATTTPAILKKHTDEFIDKCAVPGTTFQLRVFEVCEKEEQECGALLECLGHVNDKQP